MKKDANLVVLGANIKRLRKVQKLSQEELAARADLHRNFIGMIERGERNATALTLIKIALGLDLPASALFDGCKFSNASEGL